MTEAQPDSLTQLTPDAMNLAHEIGLYEAEQREGGYKAERIAYLRGQRYGAKMARLAINDPSMAFIYRPEDDKPPTLEPTTQLGKWAKRTYEKNYEGTGKGGAKDDAYID